jgi:Ca2+-binding EF-hand superfamily protein
VNNSTTDAAVETAVDNYLKANDENNDGYIEYFEYVLPMRNS